MAAAPQFMDRLGGWEGYELDSEAEEQRGEVRWCVLTLRVQPGVLRRCSSCGWVGTAIHDQDERRVRDLPIFEVPVELMVPRLRLECPHCGPKLEELGWLESYARVTGDEPFSLQAYIRQVHS